MVDTPSLAHMLFSFCYLFTRYLFLLSLLFSILNASTHPLLLTDWYSLSLGTQVRPRGMRSHRWGSSRGHRTACWPHQAKKKITAVKIFRRFIYVHILDLFDFSFRWSSTKEFCTPLLISRKTVETFETNSDTSEDVRTIEYSTR